MRPTAIGRFPSVDERRRATGAHDPHDPSQIEDDGGLPPRWRVVCRCGDRGEWVYSRSLAVGDHRIHRASATRPAKKGDTRP